MKNRYRTLLWVVTCAASTAAIFPQNWPQWRGPNRDAKVVGFKAPETWPKELTQKWDVPIGEGVATPALVGERLYVFSREEGEEVIRCLNASDGKEVWKYGYPSLGADGPASAFSGPRSSPAVADNRIVIIGVRGMITCLDAANGKVLWQKDDFKNYPRFHPSSSPMIYEGLCIAQLGGSENGALVAYDLATGEEKWRWSGGATAYSSPVLMTLDGKELIIAQTDPKVAAIDPATGKALWESDPASEGRGERGGRGGRGGGGRDYKAATPIVDGQTLITAGTGLKAVRLQKEGERLVAKELWSNTDQSVRFNTPVLKNGYLYGLTPNDELFCVNAENGETQWTAPFPGGDAAAQGEGRRGGRGGRGGGGGRMGGPGFGSVLDAGSVLLALTSGSQLAVLEPNAKELKVIATYKVANSPTHAHPVASGNRLFIKDHDSVTLWTVE